MKNSRKKLTALKVGDYISIKTEKEGKTPFHPNVLIGEILAFENEYANVARTIGVISTHISPARLVKSQATKIEINKDKITFTQARKLANNQQNYNSLILF